MTFLQCRVNEKFDISQLLCFLSVLGTCQPFYQVKIHFFSKKLRIMASKRKIEESESKISKQKIGDFFPLEKMIDSDIFSILFQFLNIVDVVLLRLSSTKLNQVIRKFVEEHMENRNLSSPLKIEKLKMKYNNDIESIFLENGYFYAFQELFPNKTTQFTIVTCLPFSERDVLPQQILIRKEMQTLSEKDFSSGINFILESSLANNNVVLCEYLFGLGARGTNCYDVNMNFETFKWLEKKGLISKFMNKNSCFANTKQIEIIKYIVSKGGVLDGHVFASFVQCGNVEDLEWAIKHGASYDKSEEEEMMMSASWFNHTETLKFLNEKMNIPYWHLNLKDLVENGNLSMLKHIKEKGVKINDMNGWDDSSLLEAAAISDKLEIFEWFIDNGASYSNFSDFASEKFSKWTLKYGEKWFEKKSQKF